MLGVRAAVGKQALMLDTVKVDLLQDYVSKQIITMEQNSKSLHIRRRSSLSEGLLIFRKLDFIVQATIIVQN